MKIFTSKNFKQKFIISIVCVILLSFCITPQVSAKSSFGGKIMGLMRSFVTAIADVGASVVQLGMTGKWQYAVDGAGTAIVDKPDKYWIKESKFQYPILQISPELIFANEVELLDANFITPSSKESYTLELEDKGPLETLRKVIAGWYVTLRTIAVVGLLSVLIYIGIRIMISSTAGDKAKYKERLMDWVVAFCLLFFTHYIMAATVTVVDKVNEMLNQTTGVTDGLSLIPEYGNVTYKPKSQIDLTPSDEGIVIGNFGLTTNLPDDSYRTNNVIYTTVLDKIEFDIACVNVGGTAKTLYKAMQDGDIVDQRPNDNFGITGEDELKKQYSIDFISKTGGSKLTVTFDIIKSLSIGNENWCVKRISTKIENGTGANATFIQASQSGLGLSDYVNFFNKELDNAFDWDNDQTVNNSSTSVASPDGIRVSADGSKVLYFTNYARLYLNVADNDEYLPMATAYLIIYIALVSFTVVFALRYIKRVIYIAWLTLMAPMVALTYPIDKIKDRKSTSLEYVV